MMVNGNLALHFTTVKCDIGIDFWEVNVAFDGVFLASAVFLSALG